MLKACLEPFRLFQVPFSHVERLGFEIRRHRLEIGFLKDYGIRFLLLCLIEPSTSMY